MAAPLFAQPEDVPSVVGPAPSQQWTAGADRARPLVRVAISEENLPGLSIAVGAGGGIVWAEGFGWRDVDTRTPVTPNTRFNIGTAAAVVAAAAWRAPHRVGAAAQRTRTRPRLTRHTTNVNPRPVRANAAGSGRM